MSIKNQTNTKSTIKTHDVFRKAVEFLETATTTTKKYVEFIATQLERNDPEKYMTIIRLFARYPEIAVFVMRYGDIKGLPDVITLYEQINEIDDTIEALTNVISIDAYYESIINKMSSTFDVNISELRNNASQAWTRYKEAMYTADEEVFSSIAKSIIPKDIDDLINKGGRIVLRLLRTIAPTLPSSSQTKISEFIEREKDRILGCERISGDGGDDMFPAQLHCYRYNLAPKTQMLEPKMIIKLINPTHVFDKTKDGNTNICEATKALNVGLYICGNNFGTRLEYDIRGLVDEQYITEHNLFTSLADGLNKKVMKRYETITRLNVPDANKNITAEAKRLLTYNPITAKEMLVVETHNGNTYRIMGLYDSPDYLVPINRVVGFLKGQSTRPSYYNKYISDEIFKRCITKTTDVVVANFSGIGGSNKLGVSIGFSDYETAGMSKDIGMMKQKIIDLLIGTSEINTKEDYWRQYKNIIVKIDEVILKVLVCGIGLEERVTYLYKIEDILSVLRKELRNAFRSFDYSDSQIKHKNNADLEQYIKNSFVSSFGRAIDELDKKGIWSLYDASLKELYMSATNIY